MGGVSDIEKMINYKEICSKENIVNNFENQLEKLKKREIECNIRISDFIEKIIKQSNCFMIHIIHVMF